ncbi:MAG: hypothetical protein HOB29_12065 [Planctomycetaceae bacterium]|jgi:hypothetical protein|nr:hypothetical protein [Planctomycetaceae bacterium]MBT5123604.1 hypothetical protein [Planctomycetaceae bacterium]
MKLTKRLTNSLDCYSVKQRKSNSPAKHVMTGKVTDCDPLTFAVYEAAIKSIYLSWALHPIWPEMCELGHDRHYQAIAAVNGFKLPDADVVDDSKREKIGRRAAADHLYFVSLISKAGLFHSLID